MGQDDVGQGREVIAQQVDQVPGATVLGDIRKPGQVGEHDGGFKFHAAQLEALRVGDEGVHHVLGDVMGEGRAQPGFSSSPVKG